MELEHLDYPIVPVAPVNLRSRFVSSLTVYKALPPSNWRLSSERDSALAVGYGPLDPRLPALPRASSSTSDFSYNRTPTSPTLGREAVRGRMECERYDNGNCRGHKAFLQRPWRKGASFSERLARAGLARAGGSRRGPF